jgi:oligopeptide transport system substrate-binding protein
MKPIYHILLIFISFCLTGCEQIWNDPYPESQSDEAIFYTDFNERPKYLDPAKAYSAAESRFIGQIYEPPLQYNYLIRPYVLEPLLATQMPSVRYYNAQDVLLPMDASGDQIAYSVYEIAIKPGVVYQNHPAFAKNSNGQFLYHDLTKKQLRHIHTLSDFTHTATRELTAQDFVHQIKRIAHPALNSPILGLMNTHIVGLEDYSNQLAAQFDALPQDSRNIGYLDLRNSDFAGAKVIDRYTYQIKVIGKYPQFMYWLAMEFFAPMPWEAEVFYGQPGLIKKNIILDWYPVGTGPFTLTVNNPNRQMVLTKNPNFRKEYFPNIPDNQDAAFLPRQGLQLPFLDKIVFNLEKETIPRWTKFLQGYYDLSTIGSDNFQQAIVISNNSAQLSPLLQEKGISIYSSVSASTFYWGFNMLDEVVGGYEQKNRDLRQAIAMVMDVEEYISIFLNERGIAAQGPIPPGIEGYQEGEAGINPYIYEWQDNRPQRLPLARAKALLARAGYPNGIDARTNKPLVLNYDVITTGDPEEKAQFAWVQKQLNKLNIELNIRATDTNRFREKMSTGYAQIFTWGWGADYPDPENFLFLLYGPNARVGTEGVNSANYKNKVYDALFEQLRNLDAGPKKQAIIAQMLAIIREDSPWVWGYHPQAYTLAQVWNAPHKPNEFAANSYKYYMIDTQMRETLREKWNKPILWPLFALLIGIVFIFAPVLILYLRKEYHTHKNRIG